jgi:hypothetical protein
MSPPFSLDFSITGRFFDRAKVVKEIDVRERRALSRMGAFIQRRAKTDVLRRTMPYGQRRRVGRDRTGRYMRIRQSATGGQPPIIHSRDKNASLRRILFALGPDNQSVLVGPARLPGSKVKGSNRQTVPELLEFGGTALVTESEFPSGGVYPGQPSQGNSTDAKTRTKVAKYRGNPFMSVALEREASAGTLVDAFDFGVKG